MKWVAVFALCIQGLIATGQSSPSAQLRFMPRLADRPLQLDSAMVIADDLPVTITAFRFYVGHFMSFNSNEWVSAQSDHHLVDVADPASLMIDIGAAAEADSISFLLGVDSLTNRSGAFGGDLDPINGMYWTWNSGYINLKLEGSSPVSPYPSRAFELHLGGYMSPFATVQRVTLPVGVRPFVVSVDVMPLLYAAGVHTRCNVMSPGERAVQLSKVAATMFKTDAAR